MKKKKRSSRNIKFIYVCKVPEMGGGTEQTYCGVL